MYPRCLEISADAKGGRHVRQNADHDHRGPVRRHRHRIRLARRPRLRCRDRRVYLVGNLARQRVRSRHHDDDDRGRQLTGFCNFPPSLRGTRDHDLATKPHRRGPITPQMARSLSRRSIYEFDSLWPPGRVVGRRCATAGTSGGKRADSAGREMPWFAGVSEWKEFS